MSDAEVRAHRELVASAFPELEVDPFVSVGGGWDCFTYEVGSEWIVQLPRNDHAEALLLRQIAILPELAREVSAPIPVPELTSARPPIMGYRKLAGRSLSDGLPEEGGLLPERLGRFLYDLHLVPLEFLGLRGGGPGAWREQYERQLAGFRTTVVPLLDPGEAVRAERMFDAFLRDDAHFRFPDAMVHADLGPEHILCSERGDLAGVIDWGDAIPGDPAIDFAWLLRRAPEIGERALAAYGGASDPTFRERAAFYDALDPWYEAHHGLVTDQPAFVRTGLEAVRDRLP